MFSGQCSARPDPACCAGIAGNVATHIIDRGCSAAMAAIGDLAGGRMIAMDRPRLRIASVVIGGPDPVALAAFYERLLGWTVTEQYGPRPGFPPSDGWAMLRPAEGRAGLGGLAIQWEPDYEPPAWPPVAGQQQMMLHLDIAAEDLDAAAEWAVQAGA